MKIDMPRNPSSTAEAIAIQERLRYHIDLTPLNRRVTTIAGCDISHNRFDPMLYAAIVVFSFPEMRILETGYGKARARFPYIPGFLSFREIPALAEAYSRLKTRPDVFMLDGQGIAHPRRMGIAAHFGVEFGVSAFGCAKSKLFGVGPLPSPYEESISELRDKNTVIGAYVRTKLKADPVIVSAGHKITLPESIHLTLATRRGYRLPEPTRTAHMLANLYRRGEAGPASEIKEHYQKSFWGPTP